jgi:hypothetical protein
MAWWRAHDEAVDDPKLQRLPGEMFKAWFNLVCLASRNGGVLPPLADISFRLRKSERECQRILDSLIAAKLFDEVASGIEPHNWNGRQYKSDVSTGRVRSFRKRQKERSTKPDETVSRNAPEQSRGKGNPLQGLPVTQEQPSPPIAARESAEGAHAHETASILANLGNMKRAVQ